MGRRFLIAVALALCIAAAALAQRRFNDGFGFDEYARTPPIHNVPYDGQFTFVRVQYDTAPGGYWAGGRPSWIHGYPLAEENLMRIMNDLSFFNARTDEVNVISLEDPELFKYPLAYIIEVGWWLGDAAPRAARLIRRRLRHRRRLQDHRLARQRHRRLGPVRAEHEPCLPRREVLRHGHVASELSRVFRN